MTWEAYFICGLIVLTIASFIAEKIPPDITALCLFSVLLVSAIFGVGSTLPNLKQLLSVFASEAPMTVAAMFVINSALEKCGIIEILANKMGYLAKFGYSLFILFFILIVSAFSAFMNNTAVVMVLLPVALSLSRKIKVSPSKVLIPLSYASIFGGCCTLIGTSTNILASSVATQYGLKPISMFELAYVGIPLTLASAIYIALFGKKLLPDRETLYSLLPQENRKEFIIDTFIKESSPLVGIGFIHSQLANSPDIRLIDIIRDGHSLHKEIEHIPLQVGDRLLLACKTKSIGQAHCTKGLSVQGLNDEGLEQISTHEASVIEAIIPPKSKLIGQYIKETNLRQQFRTVLLAVHRKGINLQDKTNKSYFESGDTLLLMGADSAIEALRGSSDLVVLDLSRQSAQNMKAKAPLVLSTIVTIVTLSALNIVPIVAGAIIGVCFLMISGCIKPQEAYNAIEWRILIIIYSSLALGLAMESTSLASFLGEQISLITQSYVAGDYQPFVLFAAMYICTAMLTEVLSNNATVVIMTPIAISVALSVGVDPRPFMIATCIGASNAFATPIGYQTNTYVYTIGGYRFTDFFKIGILINLVYLVGVLWIVPKIWPF